MILLGKKKLQYCEQGTCDVYEKGIVTVQVMVCPLRLMLIRSSERLWTTVDFPSDSAKWKDTPCHP